MSLLFQRPSSLTPSLVALGLASLMPTAARAQTQDLFVSNQNNQGSVGISRFAGTGPGTFSTTATKLTTPSLNMPEGLAFDAKGDLFAANYAGGSNGQGGITEFMAGATPGAFGAIITITDPSLINPQGVAVDARGDLFTADGSHIVEFTVGATPGSFGPGMVIASAASPVGLAFDARGNLFAADEFNDSITEFTFDSTSGTFSEARGIGGGLAQPEGLAFDTRGDLFAANARNSTITEFAFDPLTGMVAATGSQAFGGPNSGLAGPFGLAFDARGDLFAANEGSTVIEFAATGPGTFGGPQTVETGLSANGPVFLAFSPPAVPEASQAVSLGLLLMLGMGVVVVASRRRKPGPSA